MLTRSATMRWAARSVMSNMVAMSRMRTRGSRAMSRSVLPWFVSSRKSGTVRKVWSTSRWWFQLLRQPILNTRDSKRGWVIRRLKNVKNDTRYK